MHTPVLFKLHGTNSKTVEARHLSSLQQSGIHYPQFTLHMNT